MKILIISNLFPPSVLGGYEILCGQVVQSLRARGHEVHILTSTHGKASIEPDDLVMRRLHLFQPFDRPVSSAMRRARLRTASVNTAITKAVLQGFQFDVVFVWSLLRLTASPARVAEQSGLPVLYTFNDEHPSGYLPARFSMGPKQFARWILDKTITRPTTASGLRFADTTCISELLKRNLVAAGLPISSSRVIHQGIPIDQFPQRTAPAEHPKRMRILYAGQLHPYKGVHTLVSALHLLAHTVGASDLTCSIVGAGDREYVNRLESDAGKAGIPVTFLGRVPHDRMGEIYRSHDLLVFPSIWPEPFGLTHLEAMASGLPVISTTNGGQGEFLVDGMNCLSFEPDNPQQLAQCITKLSGDARLYDALVAAGRETVEKGFTFDRYVSDLETLLTDATRS
jgi:glycosyltransferase involved in cell wall biosynthesis